MWYKCKAGKTHGRVMMMAKRSIPRMIVEVVMREVAWLLSRCSTVRYLATSISIPLGGVLKKSIKNGHHDISNLSRAMAVRVKVDMLTETHCNNHNMKSVLIVEHVFS